MKSSILFFVGLLSGIGVIGLAGNEWALPNSPIECREIASDVGLEHTFHYGPVPSEEEGARIMQRNMGHGAAVADYDSDGDLDVLLLAANGHLSRLFRNELVESGELSFRDVTEIAGIADTGLSRAAEFVDLNGDGMLDLVLANDYSPGELENPSRLFMNRGDGRFSDVTTGSGFDPVGYIVGGLSVTDVNEDGLPDIYVSYWTMELGDTPKSEQPLGVFPGSNKLYLNRGEFRFEDATEEFGLADLTVDSFSASFYDFDEDGRLDLYQALDHRPDRFFSLFDGTFVDRSLEVGVGHEGNSMGLAVGDPDGDLRTEIFVTNIWDPLENFGGKPRGNILLQSQDARFAEVAFESGVRESGWGWGTTFVDMDLDGHLDLVVAQGFDELTGKYSRPLTDNTLHVFAGQGTGDFTRIQDTGCDVPGDQRALIPFDADRDGRVDLLVTQVDLPVLLLKNTSRSQNSVTVSLISSGSTDLGATVRVRADGRTQERTIISGTSYLSGIPHEVTIGLGDSDIADEILVEWPDGHHIRFVDVDAGSHINARRD